MISIYHTFKTPRRILFRCFPIILFANFLLALCMLPNLCNAIEPNEILVVANKSSSKSVGVAKYYMEKRKIPKDNLIMVRVTDKETCSRSDYEKKVATPIRRYINQNDSKITIRCLVCMYGLPLKVAPPEMSSTEKSDSLKLKKRKIALENQLDDIEETEKEVKERLKKEIDNLKKKISDLGKKDQGASLDSEISLVLEKSYTLSGWIPNPYYLGFKGKTFPIKKENVLMVSRLDGPTDKIVKRIIDDSIKAEKKGLTGVAYFDARWPDPGDKKLSSYALYDRSIHLAAGRVKKSNLMPVEEDDKEALFKHNECPDAALYCGWYSLAKYIDAFKWQPGSIGYHIASNECSTLKKKNSNVWCKMMLEKGIAATVGPVSEPYVNAFPLPEIFFGFLVDGYLTLAECYIISTPYLSWKMVLVGDPLYRPFKYAR